MNTFPYTLGKQAALVYSELSGKEIELTPEEENYCNRVGCYPETAKELFAVISGNPPPKEKQPRRHWKDILGVRYNPAWKK